MNINITAEDYFNELKLMQKQYGQEEDLYPWIYMLLQMAECRKKAEEEGKEYIPVSIRDVHKAEVVSFNGCKKIKKTDAEAKKYWEIRWELTKRVGPPDFAIIDDNGEIVGCVEIKILKEELFTQEPKELKIGLPQNPTYTLISQRKPTVTKEENEVENFLCSKEGKTYKVKNTKNYVWNYTNNLPAGTNKSNQLAGHLDKFKKVLFTNGLEFYFLMLNDKNEICFLTLDENKWKTKKDKKPLADFGTYEEFKNKHRFEDVKETWEKQWKNLINGLTAISWHAEPISINTNTKEENEEKGNGR